jgi:hypothetical protein
MYNVQGGLPTEFWGNFPDINLDLLGVQQVRLENSGTEPAWAYTFLHEKGNGDYKLGTSLFYIWESYQQLKVMFDSDAISYIILRGRWFRIITLNIHTST